MAEARTSEARGALRAAVALSALPLLWKDFDAPAIAENLASVLFKVFLADFVYVCGDTCPPLLEVAWGPEGRVSADRLGAIRAALPAAPIGQRTTIRSPFDDRPVSLMSMPFGFGDGATLVVASSRSDFPTGTDRLVLRMAANEASVALDREQSQISARHLAGLVNLSSKFIGVATLEGVPLFLNPAGLKLVGIASLHEALKLHVVDFLEISDRDRARYEVWPAVLSRGRWLGQLSLLNARTGVTTPLLVETFRIDAPTGEPIAVGTMSVDIRDWPQAEHLPGEPPAPDRARQIMLAVARVDSLSGRERQVLHALVAGHSHKVIAHELGLSVRTIEVHRSRMMRRLDVRTLADAIKLAIMSGVAG